MAKTNLKMEGQCKLRAKRVSSLTAEQSAVTPVTPAHRRGTRKKTSHLKNNFCARSAQKHWKKPSQQRRQAHEAGEFIQFGQD
jgi:hypothetical protein